MNIAMLTSAGLIVVGVVGAFLQFGRLGGIERSFMTLAMLAVAALGGVGVARASGRLADRNLYLTLNIALPVLFGGLTYQVYLHRKKSNAAP